MTQKTTQSSNTQSQPLLHQCQISDYLKQIGQIAIINGQPQDMSDLKGRTIARNIAEGLQN